MTALNRKLARDLFQMSGQVITIALVVGCGIASYVSIQGTYHSLLQARDAFYERKRFPDVFVHVRRAPDSLLARLRSVPHVAIAHARSVEHVSLPVEGLAEPATGHVVSIPAGGEPVLGGLLLREGRLFEPGRSDEVVVLESFAKAHGLRPGRRLPAVLAGVRRELLVVGIALSPEYIFAISPGELMPDPTRFAVLFMDESVVEAAFQLEGAWNELLVKLDSPAHERLVIDKLNRVLEPYGSLGAYGRDRQLSNNVLRGELAQLETLTAIMPVIFLAVAAFLINVVLSRLVQNQRAQVATLKAVGYRDREVGLHYLKLVSVICLGGAVVGVTAGVLLGKPLVQLYTKYFLFPDLSYQLNARVLSVAVLSSLLAAVVGALSAVRAVMRLPPAEAMRPEAPAVYRRALSERLRLSFLFGQSARMILRELERRPVRSILSSLGVAMAVAVLIAGRFGFDAVDWFMRVQFELSQREDLYVSFRQPVSARALNELEQMPGVLRAEGLRLANVRIRSSHHSRDTLIFGHPDDADLRRVLDREGRLAQLPLEGLLLTTTLANLLGVRIGDFVTVDLLEGARTSHELKVAGLVDEVFGLFGHMRADALARVLRDEGTLSAALLSVDPTQRTRLQASLRDRPTVLGVSRRDNVVELFRQQTAGQMRFTTLLMTIFASIIASGVIYNNARVALATRSRDLASLRVLGFRRGEISAILLGELAIQVLLALVPGLLLGELIAHRMMATADPEMYRFPVIISARTYAFAIVVTFAASLASALLVRHRLDHLDLIGVLKSRE